MKKLLLTKSLLALLMLFVGTNVWGAQTNWDYSTTMEDNPIGTAFYGSTEGLVNVTIGVSSETWSILTAGSANTPRGIYQTNATATLTDGIPTSGTFMKIEALQKVGFTPKFYRVGKGNLRMVDATDTETFILNERYGGSATNYPVATLESGHTYYLWFVYDSNSTCNFAISGFTAATFTNYTINYTYEGSVISTEGEAEGYIGQTVNPANTYVWDDGHTTKYFVADYAIKSFTVAETDNTFNVALRLAATDAVASVNAIDADNNILATFTSATTGIEGEAYDGNVYYTRAVKYNGAYYTVPAANGNGLNYGRNGLVYGTPVTVTYTLDPTITYYAESENLQKTHSYAAEGAASERASGGHWYRLYKNSYAYTKGGDLPQGVYTLEVSGRNQGSGTASLEVKVRNSEGTLGDAIGTPEWGSGNNLVNTVNYILVPEGGSVAFDNPTDYNSNLGIDYIILRKVYDVTDATKIVGAVDFTTEANAERSADYTIKQGETWKFTFQNHGTTYGNNWRIEVKEGETWKSNLCADSYDYTAAAEANVTSYKMSTDGGNTKSPLAWNEYAEDMDNAYVEATLTYGTDGKLEMRTTSTGATYGYIYYVDNDVEGLTGDLTVNLSVCKSWLEVLSAENLTVTSVTATIGEAGWATLYTDKALDFSGVEGLEAAYTATVDGDNVVLTAVQDVPDFTGVILKGAPGEYEIPFTDASNTAKGSLEGNPESETSWDAYAANNGKLYILAAVNNGKDVQFVPCTSGSIAAGKAYLPVYNQGGTAKAMKVVFASETTGISNVNVSVPVPVKRIQNGQLIIEKNGKAYNAAGQLK